MNWLKRVISYLINPKSGTWRFGQADQDIEPRKVPWKGILNPPFVLGTLIVLFLIIIVWFGPKLASYDPYITSRSVPSYYDSENRVMVQPPFDPGAEYPLGTDRFGNDILSLLLFGARVTLLSCLYITGGRVLLGLVLGGISGWLEGSRFDRLIMRVSAVISSIPLLLSAMLMILALNIQKGVWVFVVSLSVLGWTEISQIVRSEFIRIKSMLYVEAAEALGLTKPQIIIRHALPNVLSYLLSIAFLEMGSVLLIMAELGFLGLFVGGGSRFRSDPFSPVIILISEIPEWGAMVAQGTPYLRTYPYMVMGPAMAFFIAIVGLNAFGEGLRRIFDRWPFSTAFILKKRMILIVGAFVAVSIVIFQMTNASVSYQLVADTFSEEGVNARYEELMDIDEVAQEDVKSPLVGYLIEKFREYEVSPGYSETLTSYHYFPISITLRRPRSEPRLALNSGISFQHEDHFAFLNTGCAGEGEQQAQISLMGNPGNDEVPDFSDGGGKIVLMLEDGIGPDHIKAAQNAGVEGLLLISSDLSPLNSQYEINPEQKEACREGEIPVFRITENSAMRIAEEALLDWDLLSQQIKDAQYFHDLELEMMMSLDLGQPETVDVPNAIGFLGGYDMDHADEIVVIYTTFDGLGLSELAQDQIPEEDLVKIALLLEIMQTWHENKLDPRRSVQFVIWGGEGLEDPYNQLITGLFEKNKLAAKVPTNNNPYINTNPVKPAIWIELGELNSMPGNLLYGEDSSESLTQIFTEAARAAKVEVEPARFPLQGLNSELPQLYIWEEALDIDTSVPDYEDYVQKGIALNRTLIQLLRDMKIEVVP